MSRQNPQKYLSDAEREEVIESHVRHKLEVRKLNRKWRRDTAAKYDVTPREINNALMPKRMDEVLMRMREKDELDMTMFRNERRSIVETLLDSTNRELLDRDAGEYGYGGEWFTHPEVNKAELVEFVLDVMEFERSVR